MKRYVSLACIAMVLVMCLVSPVSASEIEKYYYDFLDFNYVSDSDNIFRFSVADETVNIKAPFYSDWKYCDIILYSSFPLSDVRVPDNKSLSIISLGGGYYRLYGNLSGYYLDHLPLTFLDSTESGYVYFYSVRCVTSAYKSSPVPFEGVGSYSNGTFNMSKNFGDDRPTRTIFTNSDIDNRDFILYLSSPNWRAYDYVEFQCYFNVSSIDSISCTIGSYSVPFEVNYIYPDSSDQSFYLTISIDCRNLDRSLSDDNYPMVIITGTEVFDGVSLVALMDSIGYLYYDEISSDFLLFSDLFERLSAHFSNLNGWFDTQTVTLSNKIGDVISNLNSNFSHLEWKIDDLFYALHIWMNEKTDILESAIRGDTSPGNSFQQQVDQKDQQLNDMAAVMESVDQPDLNSVNVSANTYVDGTVLAASMSGITSVFSQGLFFDLIVMSIMMATAGYVLFGKR